jgi:hypothetical protein
LRERGGELERNTTFGRGLRNCIFGFEGFQAVPVPPSDRGSPYDRNLFLYDVGRTALY